MLPISKALAGAVAVVLAAGAAHADNAGDVKAWVASLYATYKDSSRPAAGAGKIYDSQLQALMAEDNRLAHGEVPALDFDPLCQCQDYQKLQAQVTVRSASAKAAVVAVHFRDLGMPGDKPRDAVLDLVNEHGDWRIHDIHAQDPKSLRAFLLQQNAERAHPKGSK